MLFYFIPSWYTKEHHWQTDDVPWYNQSTIGFDDTVNQIRMFLKQGEKAQLINLSYFPQLRRFLHRQGLYPLPYWSAFDEAQDVHTKKIGIQSYQDLPWPKQTEWAFSPFNIFAILHGKRYARINLAKGSSLLSVDYYGLDGSIVRTDLYDDRGFRSSCRTYRNGKEDWQYFFNPYGKIQFRENMVTEEVYTEPNAAYPFRCTYYVHVREMLREILINSSTKRETNSAFIIASNSSHNRMVLDTFRTENVALSYFRSRFNFSDTEYLKRDAKKASYIVTDTAYSAELIRALLDDKNKPVYNISPFDTRLVLGKSSRNTKLRIFFAADGLTPESLNAALKQIYEYMMENPDTELLPAVHNDNELNTVKKICEEVRNSDNCTDLLFEGEAQETQDMDDLAGENTFKKEIPPRIFPTLYRNEEELIDILQDVRLIVDIREQPDLYLQIAGISAGIPQVNCQSTQYVEHKKDGYLVSDIQHLKEALSYYLDGLQHWNEALVYCIRKIESYTGKSLVQQWKEIFEGNDRKDSDFDLRPANNAASEDSRNS